MNWLAVAGIILVIGADVVATAVWWPPYFAHGLLLFRSRVPLAPDAGEMPTPERLAREWGEGMGGSLLFRRLSESEVAFREPLYEWRAFSYVPVMHGLARRDVFARVVVVDGRANLFTCISAGMVMWVSGQHGGWIFPAFLGSFVAVSYALQVRRYRRIAHVVAGVAVAPGEPSSSHTSAAGNYVAWVLLAALVGATVLAWFAR